MKEITILGGGGAGLSFIRSCREAGFDGKLVLIDKNQYWYDRAKFYSDFNFKNRIDYTAFCKEHKVQFVQDIVDRVNPKRKKIYFKNLDAVDYDCLFVAPGLKPKKIPAKGEHREGFYYLSDIDILQLRDRLKFADDICLYVSTVLGIKLAIFLRSLNKDLSIAAANFDFLGTKKDLFLDWCKRENINIYLGSQIEEAIGESTVKAVKLNPLKVVSAQILFLDSGFVSGADFFEEPLEEVKSMPDIFIGGDAVCNIADEMFFVNNDANAKAQGAALALSLVKNEPLAFVPTNNRDTDALLESLLGRFRQQEFSK